MALTNGNLKLPQNAPSSANGTPIHCIDEKVTSDEIGHVSKHNVRLLVIQNLHFRPFWAWIPSKGSIPVYHVLTLGDAELILEKRPHGSVLSPVVLSLFSDQVIPPPSYSVLSMPGPQIMEYMTKISYSLPSWLK